METVNECTDGGRRGSMQLEMSGNVCSSLVGSAADEAGTLQRCQRACILTPVGEMEDSWAESLGSENS